MLGLYPSDFLDILIITEKIQERTQVNLLATQLLSRACLVGWGKTVSRKH